LSSLSLLACKRNIPESVDDAVRQIEFADVL